MPKDGASPATTSANVIYRYRVREKSIHGLQVPKNEEKRGPYAVDDIIRIKPPGSRCPTKFKLGRVTCVVSHHSVEVNGIRRHIKDLCPFQGPIPLSESETDSKNQLTEGRIPITLGPTPQDSLTDPSSSEDDVPIVPLRRSTRQRRPTRSYTRCVTASISRRRTKYQLHCDLPHWTTL